MKENDVNQFINLIGAETPVKQIKDKNKIYHINNLSTYNSELQQFPHDGKIESRNVSDSQLHYFLNFIIRQEYTKKKMRKWEIRLVCIQNSFWKIDKYFIKGMV